MDSSLGKIYLTLFVMTKYIFFKKNPYANIAKFRLAGKKSR